jgi:hypothetical protein
MRRDRDNRPGASIPIDHAKKKAWRRWIEANRPALERIGLPLAVYQDLAHWTDFLENGELHYHTDGPPFDVRAISTGQMKQLRAFLEEHYGDSDPLPDVLRILRVRLDE